MAMKEAQVIEGCRRREVESTATTRAPLCFTSTVQVPVSDVQSKGKKSQMCKANGASCTDHARHEGHLQGSHEGCPEEVHRRQQLGGGLGWRIQLPCFLNPWPQHILQYLQSGCGGLQCVQCPTAEIHCTQNHLQMSQMMMPPVNQDQNRQLLLISSQLHSSMTFAS